MLASRPLRHLLLAALFLALAIAWVWESNPFSGPVLLTLTKDHGVHSSDVVAFPLAGFGMLHAARWWAQLRRRPALIPVRSR